MLTSVLSCVLGFTKKQIKRRREREREKLDFSFLLSSRKLERPAKSMQHVLQVDLGASSKLGYEKKLRKIRQVAIS